MIAELGKSLLLVLEPEFARAAIEEWNRQRAEEREVRKRRWQALAERVDTGKR